MPLKTDAAGDCSYIHYTKLVGLLGCDPTIATQLSHKLRHLHGLDEWEVHAPRPD